MTYKTPSPAELPPPRFTTDFDEFAFLDCDRSDEEESSFDPQKLATWGPVHGGARFAYEFQPGAYSFGAPLGYFHHGSTSHGMMIHAQSSFQAFPHLCMPGTNTFINPDSNLNDRHLKTKQPGKVVASGKKCLQDETCPEKAPSDKIQTKPAKQPPKPSAPKCCTVPFPKFFKPEGLPPPAPATKQKKKKHANGEAIDPNAGGEAAWQLLTGEAWEDGVALRFAFSDLGGSRAVQRALQDASQGVQRRILDEFKGEVRRMLGDPHANHVLMSAVCHQEEQHAGYIAEELLTTGCDAAKHKYACRILCKIVSRRWRGEASMVLIGEVLAKCNSYWRMRYATFVLQEVLKYGTEAQRQRVIDGLLQDFTDPEGEAGRVLKEPSDEGEVESIYVVAEALVSCSTSAMPLAELVVEDVELLRCLVHRKFGFVLLKALLQLEGSFMDKLQQSLATAWDDVPKNSLAELQERLDSKCMQCKEVQAKCPRCASAMDIMTSVLATLPTTEESGSGSEPSEASS